MENFFNTVIGAPLGFIFRFIMNLFGGNFAVAVLLFTIIINLIMLPLTIKSQKSTMQQARIKPKLDNLKKKYGDDKVKYQQAMQELYQREHVSVAGGCLPLLLRLVFMWGVYYVVLSPLTHILQLSKEVITSATNTVATILQLPNASSLTQLKLIDYIAKGQVPEIPAESIKGLDFNFFGLDLSQTPQFSANIVEGFQLIWIIPILAFASAMLTGVITMIIQKKANPDAPNMMTMMLLMPFLSLIIAFSVPGAVGFYWACSSLIAGLLQTAVQLLYSPGIIIAKDQKNAIKARYELEAKKISIAEKQFND